ncbi:MAG: lmo0937 family membrane protein [Bacteroidia bacterium]
MGNLLYVIAVILIIGWLLGMFAFHVTGGLIHVLLVIAVIAVILRLIQGNKPV